MSVLRRKRTTKEVHSNTAKTTPDPNDPAFVAQELYRKNVELAHTNQTLSLLRAIDTLVLESQEGTKELCFGISEALINSSDYLFAGIFLAEREDSETMQISGFSLSSNVSVEKHALDLINNLAICTTSSWFSGGAKMELVDTNRISNSFLSQIFTRNLDKVEKLAKDAKFGAVIMVKLFARQKLVGVLAVGVQKISIDATEADKTLLERLSEAIGLAVDNKLLFEENQRVLKKLEQSNKKLQELDEAKDEFISMASHQLRTPLTSVKGYVSMVLEGDAGKVTAQQKILLRQSYTSAQRMVYLISDLLNVSRLRTGKFIIEPTPVNLSNVVEEELKQVEETAKSRKVKLSFEKPKEFPNLNLDDTKIRQVIMNFVDNAIYYTPSGGDITVALNKTDKTAEFTVTDNGIGVPKSEQPHLFTKFYRADNARKARPDGTGLGLFMAKKVIVASGGALIFKSTEGKGSTFGFTFPIKAMQQADSKPAKPSLSQP